MEFFFSNSADAQFEILSHIVDSSIVAFAYTSVAYVFFAFCSHTFASSQPTSQEQEDEDIDIDTNVLPPLESPDLRPWEEVLADQGVEEIDFPVSPWDEEPAQFTTGKLDAPAVTVEQLSDLGIRGLRIVAKKLTLPGYGRMTKNDLVEALLPLAQPHHLILN